jgi:hypothetical protein
MGKFVVVMEPCVMEDEGRQTYIGTRDTLKEALQLIEKEVEVTNGYYSKGDYSIYRKVNKKDGKVK